jgi:hypothetical protein
VLALLSVAAGAAACGSAGSGAASSTTSGSKADGFVTPKTTVSQDSTYLLDVVKADPGLSTYAQSGQVADKALLVDGIAFCGYLHQGGGIDRALTSVAAGAQSLESTTHLPMSVTTFNTIEGVALVVLCPSEQKLLPSADQVKIRQLGRQLAG